MTLCLPLQEMDILRSAVAAKVQQVQGTASDIFCNSVKVNIGNVFFLAVLTHNWCDSGVVAVANPREEMVFNLIVETSIKKSKGEDHRHLMMKQPVCKEMCHSA